MGCCLRLVLMIIPVDIVSVPISQTREEPMIDKDFDVFLELSSTTVRERVGA